jgi:hypothetical protein
MICWSCGGGIPDGSNFCGLCGAQQNPTDRITRSGWLRALRDDARIGLPEPPPSAGKEPGRDTLLNPALTDPAPAPERPEEGSVTTTRPRFAALAAASLPGGGVRLARPEVEGAPSGEPSAPVEPSAPPGAPSGPPVAASVEPSAPPVSGPTPSAAPSAAPPAASAPPMPAASAPPMPAASAPPPPAAPPGPEAEATPSRPAAHPAPPALIRLIPVAAAGLCLAIILWWML